MGRRPGPCRNSLKLRYDEKTRGFNAISFAVMTIMSSGVSMYALALLMGELLDWNFNFSLIVSAVIVLVYIFLGGLTSAIYNEVVQFFLIVLGFLPLTFLGLKQVGGWSGLVEKLKVVAENQHQHFQPGTWSHVWSNMGEAKDNPMGVEWFGMVMGLGFVLSFAYWCTDFLVIQRAMAAESMSAARRTPLIAAVPKMFFPFLVILPGIIAIALANQPGSNFSLPLTADGKATNYDMAIPRMLAHYFPEGVLGLGLTALMASFMSGMAGNVTAFNTVWTYDIYQSYIAPNKSDRHYLWMGRASTVVGILISLGAAYVATRFNNIMDLLQLVFGFVNAPLLATFLLGMFWKRTTGHGAFLGLVTGTLSAAFHLALTGPKGGWFGMLHNYGNNREMAQNFWTAIWAFSMCFVVTVVVSLLTRRQKSDEDLRGLVYSLTPRIRGEDGHLAWYAKPAFLAVLVLGVTIFLNYYFW